VVRITPLPGLASVVLRPVPTKKTTSKTTRGAQRGAKKKSRRRADSRRNLAPRKEKRGIAVGEISLDLAAADVAPLVEQVRAAGGVPIGAYREPLSGRPLLLATLPIASVQPTPFQRDLSPTHAKRLAEKIEESGSFLDPIIVVRGADGALWTPNGRHRLAAVKVLGLAQITALLSPDEDLAFRILALNTEKAHNLKDRSLEVIRMARALAKSAPRDREVDRSAEFESAELLTLGLVYEQNGRFAGGAYRPFLRKVDRFSSRALPTSLREREGYAARLLEIDAAVKEIIEAMHERGFKSPYLRAYVVARINPVRFHKSKRGDDGPAMAIGAALTRMAAAARKFDASSVRPGDIALAAALAPPEAAEEG
jgi:ParB family chromosome partitioning protein